MESPRLGKTILEQIPKEFGASKKATNRTWTVFGIVFIVLLFAAFWVYKERMLTTTPPVVVPVQEQPIETNPTLGDIQEILSETQIPAFHETL